MIRLILHITKTKKIMNLRIELKQINNKVFRLMVLPTIISCLLISSCRSVLSNSNKLSNNISEELSIKQCATNFLSNFLEDKSLIKSIKFTEVLYGERIKVVYEVESNSDMNMFLLVIQKNIDSTYSVVEEHLSFSQKQIEQHIIDSNENHLFLNFKTAQKIVSDSDFKHKKIRNHNLQLALSMKEKIFLNTEKLKNIHSKRFSSHSYWILQDSNKSDYYFIINIENRNLHKIEIHTG